MVEVADIFREYGEEYRRKNKLPYHVHKVINAIEACRTAKLGGHVFECDHCRHIKIAYNSCRNRHCPKCQGVAREKWLSDRKKDLLPIQYYHLVFTLPDDLNPLILRNKKELYGILFKASSETLLELTQDPKYLGAEVGFISILHTWGQNLIDHPHIHCIATGGGLSLDGERWLSSRRNFFIPVRVISRLFKGKYLAFLKKLYIQKKLMFAGNIKFLESQTNFQQLLATVYEKEWAVYCKPPFSTAEQVLEYIGRYTHRVAISNNRIERLENRKVTYRWKDYKDGNKVKLMTVDVMEFVRRFLLHVLPDKFVKIRHYGILSNRNREMKLKKCKELLAVNTDKNLANTDDSSRLEEKDYLICPCCGKGKMIKKTSYIPELHGPPQELSLIA